VRFRIDIPGQFQRSNERKNLPYVGPDLLTKSDVSAESRNRELTRSQFREHFNQVVALETGQTFGEQAKKWLHQCMLRKRKPVKPGDSVVGKATDKHLKPLIGDTQLPGNVNNHPQEGGHAPDGSRSQLEDHPQHRTDANNGRTSAVNEWRRNLPA
jgi:hypothetical protein